MTPNRADALALMEEWTSSESLRKHMLAVETAVVAYARRLGEDEALWSAAALLHDFDYERYPNPERDETGHPYVGVAELRSRGYPDSVTDAILGHADYTGVPRTTALATVLYACDELTGLITAATLVRPGKDIGGLGVPSLKKKFKDKAFARGVAREDVVRGAEELGVDLWEHVAFVLEAMQARSDELGLTGTPA
jgi:putative nucleotidyltransferase with HDIG domain